MHRRSSRIGEKGEKCSHFFVSATGSTRVKAVHCRSISFWVLCFVTTGVLLSLTGLELKPLDVPGVHQLTCSLTDRLLLLNYKQQPIQSTCRRGTMFKSRPLNIVIAVKQQ
uniref:Uncharacterized protein n=1 Tax=Anguilla anguilla TaxID=7936 RepID=A0A0E9WKK0_ANGAN